MQSAKNTLPTLSIWQKISAPYYIISLVYFSIYLILEKTNNIGYTSLFVIFLAYSPAYFTADSVPSLSASNAKYLNQSKFTLLCLIVHVISTDLFLAYLWTKYDVIINNPINIIQAFLMLGYSLNGNINCCHELIHRPQFIARVVGYINLGVHQFTMYPIQHLYIHHKKVGTPEDPITAEKNYSIFRYYFRAIASAYKENFRYSKPFFVLMFLLQHSYVALLVLAAKSQGLNFEEGLKKVGFFIGYAYFGLFLLEVVEYVEHYGLIYRKSVQKNPLIAPECSWNATPNLYINLISLRFERHSDHHMNAYKSFNTLDLTDKMPHFPFDFPVAMTLAIFPPLWHKIMNPFVDQVIQGKQVSKDHIKFTNVCTHAARIAFIGLAMLLIFVQ